MKTLKLKLDNSPDINHYMLSYNDIVRYSFNRFQDGFKEIEVRGKCRELFKENSWFIQCAIKTGLSLFNKHKDTKIIFGGKNNLKRYMKGLITKDEFKKKRMLPITIQGEKLHKGNRLFNFDLENNLIYFKPDKNNMIELKIVNPHKNYRNELLYLQNLIDDKQITVTISINNEYVYLIYDESLINDYKFKDLKNNRLLGIDLNPNYIGLSILEFNKNDGFKVLHKQVFDLSKLTNKNKKKFELIEINKSIIKLCDYWNVSTISIEDLNIKHKSLNKGKKLNKLCLNDWCRNLTINNLKLLCSIHGIKFIQVSPAYSSQVGNIIYGNENTPDMIAASIEMARRGYKKFEKGWFYPDFNRSLNLLNEQWKQTLKDNFIKDWKELFKIIKNSKLKYRVPLSDCLNNHHGFSFNHIKSSIIFYTFI